MTRNKKFKRWGICAGIVVSLSTMSILGCGKNNDEPLIIVQNSDDELVYDYINCTRDDVYLTTGMKCTYRKNGELEVYFPVSGKIVDKVYVKKGDEVKKGDVLAELSTGNLETQIAQLEYKIKNNELQLGYIDEQEEIDVQRVWVNYSYGSYPMSAEDRDKQLESIYKRNNDSRTSINDTLEFDRLKLAQLKNELAQSRVYATFDGVVYNITDNLEGSTSNIDQIVMTIVDNSEGYFDSDLTQYAQYFKEGEALSLSIGYGPASGTYEVVPDNMAGWEDNLRFVVYSGDIGNCEAGTTATITVTLDKRENVLALPYGCVHEAAGEYYVYIVNEEGIREVKWIEIGLVGNEMIEVTGGLEEGEKVIRR